VYVPFPIAAPFGVTATKKAINTAFSIHAATPNPAVTETAVRVTLKQSGNVTVSIKNVLGQTVATLANGFETAGEKTYTWNIGSANAGIYFYTVESAGFAASAKINVVR
jgi:flagellar hook assembly protein FlgD